MSDLIVRNIVEQRLKNNWVLTDIDYENIKYVPKRGTPFITPYISEMDSDVKGIKCQVKLYTILIEVRVPKNKGTITMDSYIRELKGLLGGYQEGNFYCLKGHAERVGGAQQWYQKNVIFQCKYKQVD